jgi:hypothetical protein
VFGQIFLDHWVYGKTLADLPLQVTAKLDGPSVILWYSLASLISMTDSDPSVTNPTPAESAALPLEELQLTPEWVKSSGKSYTEHSGGEREPRREGRRPDRDRHPARGQDRERRPRPPRPPEAGDRRGPRPEVRRGGPPPPRDRERASAPAAPPTLPVDVTFQPEDKGFAAMVEAMKQTQRAYALFDIAKLVLNKPERHVVKFVRQPAADGSREPMFLVMPGEYVCLRQDEAVRFVLRHQAAMIFKEKKTPIDPPKGSFTFVNRCGLTGVWLGPPNYHEYQSRLVRHHQQRLRHMPFDEFKSRIQTVKDPEAVTAWIESMSAKTEYECILDAEPKTFSTREELEKHFIETHLAQFVTAAPDVKISGTASRQLQHAALLEAVRLAWQQERKFPLRTANEMRGRLRHEGFHFFKDPKGITHISRIKPQRFESIAHLSEQIQKLIVYLREHFGSTRKQLLAHFVPQPVPTAPTPPSTPDVAAPAPAPALDAGAPPVPAPRMPSVEDRVLADLHWLIQDGYVVEFSNGRLWALADKPPQLVPAAAVPTTTKAPAESAIDTQTTTATEPVVEPPPTPEPVPAATESGEPSQGAPAVS